MTTVKVAASKLVMPGSRMQTSCDASADGLLLLLVCCSMLTAGGRLALVLLLHAGGINGVGKGTSCCVSATTKTDSRPGQPQSQCLSLLDDYTIVVVHPVSSSRPSLQ